MMAISAASAASFAGGFEGWQVSAGVDSTNAKLTGGEYANLNSGADQGYGASDAANRQTGMKLGVSYGVGSGSFLTTFGADFITGKNTISNSVVSPNGNGGPNSISANHRFDLYVAPGYKINPDTVAYAKLGYTSLATGNVTDTSSGASVGSGPGSNGLIYGLGFKQKFDHNSPYFYAVDYTVGSTNSGQILDASGAGSYDAKIKFSSLSLNVGYSF